MRRPQLLPGLRPMWRAQGTMQFGLQPGRGTVLTGLRAGDAEVIAALDGQHDVPALEGIARSHGLPTARVGEILGLLAAAQVLVCPSPVGTDITAAAAADRADLSRLGHSRERLAGDADAWSVAYAPAADGLRVVARRAARSVRVDGAGRLATEVVRTLGDAGVGRVESASGTSCDDCDLIVVIRDDVIDVSLAEALLAQQRPHLAVVVGPDRVVVGPLVLPGRGPCLRCLHLHRRDRDPAWPFLLAQLGPASTRRRGHGEVASATTSAGLTSLQVLLHLDQVVEPASVAHTLDVVLPDGLIETRRWGAHPSCGCSRPPWVANAPVGAGQVGDGSQWLS